MGTQATPERLFYDFCLEDHVPADHLLRRIDPFLDLSDVREGLKSSYSPIGRPSIDPALMIRMLMVGYCLGIRSERRICDEVHLNLAYRWFCRLGLMKRPSARPASGAEVRFAVRPGGAVDRRAQRPSLLCLCDQLSGRCGECRDRRC